MTHQELQMMVNQLTDYQVNKIAQSVMRYLALNKELSEIKPDCCPYCGDQDARYIRKGIQRGKQRFQCKSCGHKFTYDSKQVTSNSQQPVESWVVVLEDTLHLTPPLKESRMSLHGISYASQAAVLHGSGDSNL